MKELECEIKVVENRAQCSPLCDTGVGEDNAVQRRRQEELLNPCAAGPGWPEGRAGAGCHSDRTIVSRLSQVTAAVFPNADLLLGQTQCLGNCARWAHREVSSCPPFLLFSILVSFILFDQLWKNKQLDCETKYFVLWMLLSLRTIQREAVLKSTSPFKSYSLSFSKASLESWVQNIGVVQPPLARATYLSLEFHPKTSLPMARCPKSGKLSRFAFGPVAVPSSVALARFGGSQAHRDHLQPPKIFLFSKKNTFSFIPSGFGCFRLANGNKTEAHSERLDEPWRPLVCFIFVTQRRKSIDLFPEMKCHIAISILKVDYQIPAPQWIISGNDLGF